MTGPEHYLAAEVCLGDARDYEADVVRANEPVDATVIRSFLAEAQVHATLALAASNVEHTADHVQKPEWIQVLT